MRSDIPQHRRSYAAQAFQVFSTSLLNETTSLHNAAQCSGNDRRISPFYSEEGGADLKARNLSWMLRDGTQEMPNRDQKAAHGGGCCIADSDFADSHYL